MKRSVGQKGLCVEGPAKRAVQSRRGSQRAIFNVRRDREVLQRDGGGACAGPRPTKSRHRAPARQGKRKRLGGKACARGPKQHAQPRRARCEHPARTPPVNWHERREKNATSPDPRAEMHAHTETREKASERMRPSSEVTPRRVAASEGGIKTPGTV